MLSTHTTTYTMTTYTTCTSSQNFCNAAKKLVEAEKSKTKSVAECKSSIAEREREREREREEREIIKNIAFNFLSGELRFQISKLFILPAILLLLLKNSVA